MKSQLPSEEVAWILLVAPMHHELRMKWIDHLCFSTRLLTMILPFAAPGVDIVHPLDQVYRYAWHCRLDEHQILLDLRLIDFESDVSIDFVS